MKIQKFDPDIPIYRQIVDDLINDLITGVILPNSKMLSVREMALLYKVNPNTIQNVISELESFDVIEIKKNVGIYSKSSESIANLRKKIIEKETQKFKQRCVEMNIDSDELELILEDLCKK